MFDVLIYVVTETLGSITNNSAQDWAKAGGGGITPTKCIKTKPEERQRDCTQFLTRRIFAITHQINVGVKHVERDPLAFKYHH